MPSYPAAMQTYDFKFHNLTIRAVDIEGEPWFVAADVCRALGLSTTGGATRHLSNLNQTEVSSHRVQAQGRPSAIVSESGLYKLVMRSDKPEAKKLPSQQVLPADDF